MINQRRAFLKTSGMAGLVMTGLGILEGFSKGILSSPAMASPLDLPSPVFQISPPMQEDYQSALKILNPSQKQLEHGWELHRNSLVIDGYGFMPRAAVDGDLIADAIMRVARAALV